MTTFIHRIYYGYMRTIINVKTETTVKQQAKRLAADLGLSLSAVVNAYLKQFVRNREVYFSAAPKMTLELETLLGPIEKDVHRRKFSPAVTTSEELEGYLNSL